MQVRLCEKGPRQKAKENKEKGGDDEAAEGAAGGEDGKESKTVRWS